MNTLKQLKSRAMLAYLNVGVWSARKLDRTATEDLTHRAQADLQAARVNKNLLACADEDLKAISKIGQAARYRLNSLTFPWDNAGNRLLANVRSVECIREIETYRQAFNASIEKFITAYPDLKQRAITALGTLADPLAYPTAYEIRSKFRFELSLTPLPESTHSDFFDIKEHHIEEIKETMRKSLEASVNTSLKEAWGSLQNQVASVITRVESLKQDNATRVVFKKALSENIISTCDVLNSLNLFDSNELRLLCMDTKNFAMFDVSEIKTSRRYANQVQDEATKLLARLKTAAGE